MRSLQARWLLVFLLAFSSFATAAAQEAPPQTEAPAKTIEQKLSPQEAEELLRSVDAIFKFVSERTKLPILHPVKRELVSREQLKAFVGKRIQEDESAQRLQRSEVVLKKFGLLPREFDLRDFLLELLAEQVAGYYDPKAKTVYLLDWIKPEQQKPVLAHELTHALLDQHFDLTNWLNPQGEKKTSLKPDGEPDLEMDDDTSARHALAEGQAMAVFLDYLLQPYNRQFQFEPELTARFRESFMQAGSEFPFFRSAPLMLKESLNFPYSYGLEFVRHALLRGGKELAYSAVMQDPPRTTRDILMPEKFLAGERIPAMQLPKLRPALGSQYEPYDAGTLGQFDMMVLLKQFRGERTAEQLAPYWRGGVYYAAVRAGTDKAQSRLTAADIGLMFVTRWSTAEHAQKVAAAYAAALPKKYARTEGPSGSAPAQRWMTEEGPVFMETYGDLVLVMEGLDEDTAARLREVVRTMVQAPFPRLLKKAAN